MLDILGMLEVLIEIQWHVVSPSLCHLCYCCIFVLLLLTMSVKVPQFSLAWMQPGELVQVKKDDRVVEFLEMHQLDHVTLWKIASEPFKYNDKYFAVELVAENDDTLRWETYVDMVYPVTLALNEKHKASISDTLNFQLDVSWHWRFENWVINEVRPGSHSGRENFEDIDRFLNKWIPIPGLHISR